MSNSFHIAFPISNISASKHFYVEVLGCSIGRAASGWMDINFFGHQLTLQVNPKAIRPEPYRNHELHPFPTYHFGLVLEWSQWHELLKSLEDKNVRFLMSPQVVFEGEVGEQNTFFIKDPDGYNIEFKTFRDQSNLFKA